MIKINLATIENISASPASFLKKWAELFGLKTNPVSINRNIFFIN